MRKKIFCNSILAFLLILFLSIFSSCYSQCQKQICGNNYNYIVYSDNIDADLSHIIDVDSVAAEFDEYDLSIILIKIDFYGKAKDNSDSIDISINSAYGIDDVVYYDSLEVPYIIRTLTYKNTLFENEECNKFCFEMGNLDFFRGEFGVVKPQVTFVFFNNNGKTIEGMSISKYYNPSEHLLELLDYNSDISTDELKNLGGLLDSLLY